MKRKYKRERERDTTQKNENIEKSSEGYDCKQWRTVWLYLRAANKLRV